SGLNLTGEGALMAALRHSRSSKMSDIVATIQSEQDAIIRSDADGVLVIQGGPGTGKTAVALHRAAYLLYVQRERLARSGILVIGPSDLFIRYIDNVLPSLGESDVVSTTLEALLPDIHVTTHESATVEEIKGRHAWKNICRRAVASLERPLEKEVRIRCGADSLILTPDDVHKAQEEARLASSQHNVARQAYASYLVHLLARQAASLSGTSVEESPWIIQDIASSVDIRREVNLHWLPSSAPDLLERIFARPDFLRRIAPELSEAERELLYRPKGSGFARGDIALIDELSELLGRYISPSEQVRIAREKAERDEAHSYISQAFRSMRLGDGIINADSYAKRYDSSTYRSPLSERASRDREWTYGHIIVDEAQELTPMQWEMLTRRCPSHSMTIVGDIDQRQQGAPRGGWDKLLGRLARHAHFCNLSVSYRTPGQILRAASKVMDNAGWKTGTIVPAREEDNCLHTLQVADLTHDLVGIACSEIDFLDAEYGKGHGLLAIIAPEKQLDDIAGVCREAQLNYFYRTEGERDTARIHILSARQAKGLEYDSVILVEPAHLFNEGAGNLYVALTRATRKLTCVYTQALPKGLE
ncbi:MAG: AAA family ATPase, partial [Actinomycetaceae bacterium]|nr:AAA family ATPase [Actinomycetaceae bacterium]